MLRVAAVAALVLALAGTVGSAWGQAQKQGQAAATAPAKPPVPGDMQLAILIQTAVVAASQANLTGNYTVLHALASPGFQQANPPEKLAQIFSQWREKRIDLTPIIIFSPILSGPAVVTDQNLLHVTGYYKTSPQQVHFDLLFQPVANQWRLFGISLGTQPAAAQPAAQPQAATPARAPAAKPAAADKKKGAATPNQAKSPTKK